MVPPKRKAKFMQSRSINPLYICIGLAAVAALAFLGLVYFEIAPPSSSFLPTLFASAGLVACVMLAILLVNMQGQWSELADTLERTQAKLAIEVNAGRAKSSFLGKISHELRTPLNAIIGYADVLTQHMFGPIGSPRYDDYAMNIRQGGETLLNIVNDLFEIARANARDGEFTCEPIDAGVVGGMVVVNVVPSPGGVHIMVTDNGVGIPQEHLDQLATPFAQVEEHASRTHGGLGLGLAIARGLV